MNTDQMVELLDMLTLDEVALLATMAKERKEVMEQALVENAKAKFIKAYQEFRKLAPYKTGYIWWEYNNNSGDLEAQNFDLYEMLDFAIKHMLICN